MALKAPKIYSSLPAISLLILVLFPGVICKYYGRITNTSLRTKAAYKYSQAAALSFPIHHTRAQCAELNQACENTIDCCETSPDEIACVGTVGAKSCQNCINRGENCNTNDKICCIGLKCGDALSCVDDPDTRCVPHDSVCYPSQFSYIDCCNGAGENYRCITDAEGKSKCSEECSYQYGDCNNSDECCTGFYCDTGEGLGSQYCNCQKAGFSCDPNAIPNQCCENLECVSDGNGGNKCQTPVCIDPGASCTGINLPCCASGQTCGSSGKCCVPENSACVKDDPNSACCDGYECQGATGSQTCQTPCKNSGDLCDSSNNNCCAGLTCSPNSDGNSYCKSQCSVLNGQCSSTIFCCPGYYCLTINGNEQCNCFNEGSYCTSRYNFCCPGLTCDSGSQSCQAPCKNTGDTCDSSANNCCAGLTCDSKCCVAEDTTCDPNAAEDPCCGELICLTIDGSSKCSKPCFDGADTCNVNSAIDTRKCCSPLTCDSVSQKCCGNENTACDPAAAGDPCCGDLECLEIENSNICVKPCFDGADTCDVDSADDPRECCSPLTCDTDADKCCAAAQVTCDPTATVSTCCDGLTCDAGTSTCIASTCVAPDVSCSGQSLPCCTSGQTCDAQADKCCAAAKVTCDPTATVSTCCDGLKCDSQSQECCTAENNACDITAREDTCCEGFKCVEGEGGATCQVQCADAEESCSGHGGQGWGSGWRSGWGSGTSGSSSNPCCSPLTCDSHAYKCCAGVGVVCDLAPCCRGTTCDSDSNTCVEIPCVPRGTSCDDTDVCCRGLTCDSTSHTCLGDTWTQCNSTFTCSSGHNCENSMCKPAWCFPPSILPFQAICLKGPYPNNSNLSTE